MISFHWLLVACGGGDGIDFPDRLVPLEADDLADWPTGADPYPESLSVVAGDDRDGDRFWALARS